MTLSGHTPADGASHTVALPSGEFHYRSWISAGQQAPPAVLLHANAATCGSWSRVAPALADRFRVYAPDLRGHGGSPRPGTYGLREAAEDIHAFLRTLGLAQPLVVGHSWGAAVAMVLAATGPPPRGLVLEDPPPAVSPAALETHLRVLLRTVAVPAGHLHELVAAVNPDWHPADVASLADGLGSADPDVVRALVRDGAATGPLLPLLASVTAPVLLLRAAPTVGGLLSDADWERARRLLPLGSTALDLPETPHEIHRASFDRFVAAVRDFATRLPPTPPGAPRAVHTTRVPAVDR
jgi:pimeloyl-ACP methyl ester carboxylesterase